MTQSEPAAVLAALVERLNPLTPAESARDLIETLAGLVAQAADRRRLYATDLAIVLRDAQVPIYEAMQGMPRAAPRSVLQGGQGLPRSSGSGETLDAASDAHSPGTGRRWACPRCGHDLEASITLVGEAWRPLPTSPDGVSELEWWNDNGVLRAGGKPPNA